MAEKAVNANPAGLLREKLPADLFEFLREAGETAEKQQQRIYLVCGAVRDLLLGRSTVDLDLSIEGDAIGLAKILAVSGRRTLTTHPRFRTARLDWDGRSADIVTARSETYSRPGALPAVRPGTIINDMARRDFTVNAMAVELNPRHFGDIIDPYGGRRDLEHKLIRILHDNSFADDPTRIWRAVRYEQRLGFSIEPKTLKLLKRDVPKLATVSGDRLRHELERVLAEELPEKALVRAAELGLLSALHPSLRADEWLSETFAAARRRSRPSPPDPLLYLALLVYRLAPEECEEFVSTLHFPKKTSQALRDTAAIKTVINELSVPGLAPSKIYDLLYGRSLTAITAGDLASGSPTAAEHIELFLNVLRHVNPALTGEDLRRMGVPAGPNLKELLVALREARLDGKASTRHDEEEIVSQQLK